MGKLQTIFSKIEYQDPPAGLESRIIQKISLLRGKSVRKKLILDYLGLAFSLAGFVYATLIFRSDLLHSSFLSLVSLLFSDISIVLAHWQDFVFSLLETFPVLSAVYLLVPVIFFLMFLKLFFNLNSNNHYSLR